MKKNVAALRSCVILIFKEKEHNMKKGLRIVFILACALVLLAGASANAKEPEFKGKIGKTLAGSEEYWPEYVKPPKEAPNVLIWLIDDMGYGHSSAFGGLTPMPTIDRLAENGLRQQLPHHRAVFALTRGDRSGPQPPPHRHGISFADRHGFSRLQRPPT
jgi:arylsulfatase